MLTIAPQNYHLFLHLNRVSSDHIVPLLLFFFNSKIFTLFVINNYIRMCHRNGESLAFSRRMFNKIQHVLVRLHVWWPLSTSEDCWCSMISFISTMISLICIVMVRFTDNVMLSDIKKTWDSVYLMASIFKSLHFLKLT
jgi:hypothetical protein